MAFEHIHSGHEAIKSGGANACPICQAFEIVSLKIERDRLKAELEKVQAACAVMREALRETKPRAELGSDEWHRIENARRQALSTNCGTTLIERLKEVEGQCEQLAEHVKNDAGRILQSGTALTAARAGLKSIKNGDPHGPIGATAGDILNQIDAVLPKEGK